METTDDKIKRLEEQNAKLTEAVARLTRAGNKMSIRTGQFGCSKHYQEELRQWADVLADVEKQL